MITHITKHFSSEKLAGFESFHGGRILRDTFHFAVDTLKRIHQVCRGKGRVGNDYLHRLLFRLEVEGLPLPLGLVLFLLLIL